jgi:hypothetical protein
MSVSTAEGPRELKRRWVRASHSIGGIGDPPFGPYLVYQAQSLGRLDVRLRREQPRIAALFGASAETEPTWDLGEHIDLARLWVMDGYELVRILHQSWRADLWSPASNVTGRLGKALESFKRVRVPLVKYAPAFRERTTKPGDLVPEAVFVPDLGVAWEIGETSSDIVTRTELADELLGFLEACRRSQPHVFPAG